jgi:hypothetical protein
MRHRLEYKTCPYIAVRYRGMGEHHGMTEYDVVRLWQERATYAMSMGLGLNNGHYRRAVMQKCGYDNPFSSALAWKYMISLGLKEYARRLGSARRIDKPPE